MTIFKNKHINIYKGKKSVLKTVRLDVNTAIKIDELQAVCTEEIGKTVSQNMLLRGIITSYVSQIEQTANTSEDKALKEILSLLKT